ncbi:MAG: dTMP kinase [Bacteroidales bacterium]|nr:dTMP kinase [Bacteroidales bacterium]
MFIVLEGLDGAGKSTQVGMLKAFLERRTSLRYIHFPRYDAPVYGELISKFLRGGFGAIGAVHPQLVALLFAEDRHTAAADIRAALQAGQTVLLDRYVYSNIAYQCAKLPDRDEAEALRKWILETEYGDFALPRPDLNIFLDVPLSFVEQNLSRQRDGQDRAYLQGSHDIHEADLTFQRRVQAIYRRQAELDPAFIAVDCAGPDGAMLPPDEIFSKVRTIYEGR